MNIFRFQIDFPFQITLNMNFFLLLVVVLIVILVWKLVSFLLTNKQILHSFGKLKFGLGKKQILNLIKNDTEQRTAFQIWVEMSTRNIGAGFEGETDAILDIYTAWNEFYIDTKERIKQIPVSSLGNKDFHNSVLNLSIQVLNQELRPHLAKWHAQFKQWVAREVENNPSGSLVEIQKQYERYDELVQDLKAIDVKLSEYKDQLYKVAFGKENAE